jgi:glutamyl-tRNA reductase
MRWTGCHGKASGWFLPGFDYQAAMSLICVGLNHQSAPMEILGGVSLTSERLSSFLGDLRRESVISEAAGLSTCNRTEFYLVTADQLAGRAVLLDRLSAIRCGGANGNLAVHSYTHRNDRAAHHLFRVAAGVDSMIVGESEILGQLRGAYETALNAGTIGGMLNSLMMRAISFGRKIRTITNIGKGNVSVASIAVRLTTQTFPELAEKKLLVIGAGETARLAAQHFVKQGVKDLCVANRTCGRAQDMLSSMPGRYIPIDRLQTAVEEADIVVCAVGAPHHIITRRGLEPVMASRAERPLLLIDLSMPRNIEKECGELQGARLIALDDLEIISQENRQQRVDEIAQVEELIEKETANFMKWTQTTETSRLVSALRRHAEAARQQHLRRYGKSMSDEARHEIERFSDSLLRSVLHDVTLNIRSIDTETEDGRRDFDHVCRLFSIDPRELGE